MSAQAKRFDRHPAATRAETIEPSIMPERAQRLSILERVEGPVR